MHRKLYFHTAGLLTWFAVVTIIIPITLFELQKKIVYDMNIANALYMMLDSMGHLLRDVGWESIGNGALVHDYTVRYPSKGSLFYILLPIQFIVKFRHKLANNSGRTR